MHPLNAAWAALVRSPANTRLLFNGEIYVTEFDDLSFGVVGRQFAHLLAILKVSGTHFAAVLSEPLPISLKLAVLHVTTGLDAPIPCDGRCVLSDRIVGELRNLCVTTRR
jgi:hypothetical protein